ncbi:MAG: glycerol-3-phosphate acyltransferase [Elusimicrobiales bacterium]
MAILLWLVAAYLVGCLNGGYYAVKLRSGQDIRALGSGNAGATNAGRLMGKRGFLLVMLFDAVKMLAALKVAALLFPGNPLIPALTMPAVLLGHIFPAQLRFRGGKGIASLVGAGVYLLSLPLLVFTALLFLLLYAVTRKYYYSGLAALGVLPLSYPGLAWLQGRPVDIAMCVSLAAGMALILAVSLRADRTVRDAAKGR